MRAGAGRLLTTPTTSFIGLVEVAGESYYQATVTGVLATPLPSPDGELVPTTHVRDYAVVVLLDQEGRIVTLEARYTLTDRTGPRSVRFRATYDRLGQTTVVAPSWLDRPSATQMNRRVVPAAG